MEIVILDVFRAKYNLKDVEARNWKKMTNKPNIIMKGIKKQEE